jgi:hypothetical protein
MSRGELGPKPYLDKPPRLFSKQEAPVTRPLRADPDAHRFEVTNSPLAKKLEPGERLYQIGRTWPEPDETGLERTYRQVEVLDASRNVKKVREEIQMPDGLWRQRGSEATRAGRVAEEASRILTAEQALRSRGKTIKSLGEHSQFEGGKGFDEVILEFDSSGKAKIVIVEVKGYAGRYVPTSEFTAVTDNVRRNVDELRTKLALDLVAPPKKRLLGLTDAELKSALKALDEQDIRLEIRLGPDTKLGSYTSGDVIKNIKKAWGDAGIRPRVPVEVRTLDKRLIDQAAVAVENVKVRDFIGSRPRFHIVTGVAEGLGIIRGPYKPGAGDIFVDATGKLVTMRALKEADLSGHAADQIARELIDYLGRSISHPTALGQAPVTILLDTAALSTQGRMRLREAIEDSIRRTHSERRILDRLHEFKGLP